ncbi:TetR/AcrR family transcriptional regulator [Agromyces mariniharenae]|uniref:TetR/AcrR family transcriptional regulator n=1 Tax=Agromyces mariniharenae TaxID=2604423 RepID=A0A5S4V1E3_9MICO|nr:TetR/AcrR family transcriptional regulator [Agromyces mariniharenae]TYL52937.1 TetR/AcrR family transcriptional regulator [Agromyces mariniharenae]
MANDTAANDTAGARPIGRTERKHRAILEAAEEMFLASGYLGTNMDELAARSQVSKQTVYKHFGSKEALFVELVTSMTDAAGDRVHRDALDPAGVVDVRAYLEAYADRQLEIVMTPRLLQLRRLVIGEVGRFPELAEALHDRGPKRAIESLAAVFAQLDASGRLTVDDPLVAATHFNWLVMGEPVNRAMLLGEGSIPEPAQRRRHVADAVRVFLAAYGPRAGTR